VARRRRGVTMAGVIVALAAYGEARQGIVAGVVLHWRCCVGCGATGNPWPTSCKWYMNHRRSILRQRGRDAGHGSCRSTKDEETEANRYFFLFFFGAGCSAPPPPLTEVSSILLRPAALPVTLAFIPF